MDEATGRSALPLEDLRWLRALAARLVSDPHLADDAVQETRGRALERGPRDPRSLRAWLATVLRNALRHEWRGRARREARELATRAATEAPSTLEVVEELALHQRLVAAVHALDEPYRTAIVLRFLRGRSPAEIARDLGVPVKTVHTHVERGVAALRARLAPDRRAWILWLARAGSVRPLAAPLTSLLTMKLAAIAVAVVLVLVGGWSFLRASAPPGARGGPEVERAAAALADERLDPG